MTFDEWYREHYTAHDSGLIATYSAAKAGWEAAIAASASAEPLNKDRCPDCFGAGVYAKALVLPEPPDVTCIRCNGSGKVYAPRPIEAPDNSQPMTTNKIHIDPNAPSLGLDGIVRRPANSQVIADTAMPDDEILDIAESIVKMDKRTHSFELTQEQLIAIVRFAAPAIDAAPEKGQAVALSGQEPVDIAYFCELIDDYQIATLNREENEAAKARVTLMNAYRAALSAPANKEPK